MGLAPIPDAWPRQPRLALASCLSDCEAVYRHALDGISYTVSVAPQKAHLSLAGVRLTRAVKACITGTNSGFYMNLNIIDKAVLEDAMKHPDKYPQLTIGMQVQHAVNFIRLTKEQQRDVINLPRRCEERSRVAARHRRAGSRRDLHVGLSPRSLPARRGRDDQKGEFGYVHSYSL